MFKKKTYKKHNPDACERYYDKMLDEYMGDDECKNEGELLEEDEEDANRL